MKALILCLLFACTQPPVPYIQITGDLELLDPGVKAAGIWRSLGFEGQLVSSGLPECEENWTDGHEDCQLTFKLRAYPGLHKINGPDGYLVGRLYRETREIIVDTDYLLGDKLLHTLAHELGHAMLECDHLESRLAPGPWSGIMNAQATWILEPTKDDLELACEKVGLCEQSI